MRTPLARRVVGLLGGLGIAACRPAAPQAIRSTTISLDYAVDQAFVTNSGGGKPTDGILSTVRMVERLDKLGPPNARLERVRRLCGA